MSRSRSHAGDAHDAGHLRMEEFETSSFAEHDREQAERNRRAATPETPSDIDTDSVVWEFVDLFAQQHSENGDSANAAADGANQNKGEEQARQGHGRNGSEVSHVEHDLFGTPIAPRPKQSGYRRKSSSNQWRSRSHQRSTERQTTLFDPPPSDQIADEPEQSSNEETRSPAIQPPAGKECNGTPHLPERNAEERLHNPLLQIASGEKGKVRDILAAIRVLKKLEREERAATTEERQTLMRFAGFGSVALSIFPDPVTGKYKDGSWQAVGQELKDLLSSDEYISAKRTTFNAFYTSQTVITAMHQAMNRLGIPATGQILEPGCGVGNFMTLAPDGMRFIGIELDQISGRIAKALHPDQDIRIENFRDTSLPRSCLDGVIGNVPFADLKLEYAGKKLSLHDFFFAKSVDALKPRGILALVTTHYTLDKQNAAIREHLASKADFVGAIRLPSDAFKREGTAVVTDILFMRKRSHNEPANHIDPEWLGVAPFNIDGVEIPINRYFLNEPDMVLGTWSRKDTLYGGEGYSITGNGDLSEKLRAAIERLPQFEPLPSSPVRQQPPAETHLPLPASQVTEGSFFIDDHGRVCQSLDGQSVQVIYGGTVLQPNGAKTGKRLAALIRLRDLARRVLQSQNEGWPEDQRVHSRRELNRAYDRFVIAYGPINKTTFSDTATGNIRRMPNLVKFREDPDAMLVMSLENYDETTGKADKADIMNKDVVGKKTPITTVGNAEEGLLVALDQRGAVDVPFIAFLYGKLEKDVIAELDDLIFHDPESKTWETADAYLSGNVRAKLGAALTAGPSYTRNAVKLKDVQPEDVLPSDIDANLGAPWIPATDIQAFAIDLFHVQTESIQIGRVEKDAVWSVEGDYAAKQSVAATSDFGTSRAGGIRLLELALNMKTPVIHDTVHNGDREERVFNQEEMLAAREKQKLIKERFRSWIFSDPERTERLVRLYNDTYNNLRPRLFDGSHLDFPGMNETIHLRAHQRDAVWRCMSAGNTLLAQTVGAGKTFIMAAAGMKMKQAGLIRKPLYVVPNHMLEQFGREFMQLYPNAKLLIAGKEDLKRERRKHLTAKIATGEWDGIIVTHSSFERIGMSPAFQQEFLQQQIEEYEQLICDAVSADATRGHRNLIKTIEKQKARREERLRDLAAEEKKDDGVHFDQLGIDHIFIDEAQYYKNLETPTKMERVAGIQTGGSERAFDLYMKTRYLHHQHPCHGVTFATGTPISNTMVEMHTLQKFLDPEGMRSRGIDHFDAWAATFGEIVDTMEIAPDGASLPPRSRFARFTNLPELQQMFRAFADVQTAEMLDLPRPRLEAGKPVVVACPMSEEQCTIQQELVERYDRLRSQKVDPREDNALAITTDGRKLALDARLLSETAEDYSESKVNALVGNVHSIWQRTAANRSAQIIFCDMGVHRTVWDYSVYEEIIEKLAARGVPPTEIAAVGDADTDAKKPALFERVRSGQVRVLIGSTQKMGTGTNVQKRLVALHHLDAPWKPAEVEQREGRILRQGNENEEVAIYRYVTEGSFDAYMWQALETKAKFINQIMTGENAVRSAEDIGGQELSYAEVKALASGNPAVLTLAEADAELQRLSILKKNHADEQFLARRNLRELPITIAALKQRLSNLNSDLETLTACANDPITIGERHVIGDDVVAKLAHSLDCLPKHVREMRRFPLGVYRGLHFGLVRDPQWAPELYLEGKTVRQSRMSREHHGPRAVLNALERLADSYESECDRVGKDLEIAEAQLLDYEKRLDKPFHHESYLCQLTDVRDQLKACLSGATSEPNAEPPASASELAEQIKSLNRSHTVEVTPTRISKRRTVAEEPVTARIRRQMKATLQSVVV